MFIECQNGTYFNADKAICYDFMKCGLAENTWSVVANYGDKNWLLALYSTEERAKKECRNIIFWIRSVQGLERSNPDYLSKFIYSMPKE